MALKDWKFVFARRRRSLSAYVSTCSTLDEVRLKFTNAGLTTPTDAELENAKWQPKATTGTKKPRPAKSTSATKPAAKPVAKRVSKPRQRKSTRKTQPKDSQPVEKVDDKAPNSEA